MCADSGGKFCELRVGAVSHEHDLGLSKTIRVTHHLYEQTAIETRHVDVDEDDVAGCFANGMQAAERALVKAGRKSGKLEATYGTTAECVVVVNDEHLVHVQPANG